MERDDILWVLNDWSVKPGKIVRILKLVASSKELFCWLGNALISCLSIGSLICFLVVCLNEIVIHGCDCGMF